MGSTVCNLSIISTAAPPARYTNVYLLQIFLFMQIFKFGLFAVWSTTKQERTRGEWLYLVFLILYYIYLLLFYYYYYKLHILHKILVGLFVEDSLKMLIWPMFLVKGANLKHKWCCEFLNFQILHVCCSAALRTIHIQCQVRTFDKFKELHEKHGKAGFAKGRIVAVYCLKLESMFVTIMTISTRQLRDHLWVYLTGGL